MTSKDFLIPKTDAEWFLFYLFNDPDFIAEKLKIFENLKQVYGDGYSAILMAFNKGELLAELSKTVGGKDCLNLIDKVSTRFEVPTFIIEVGLRHNQHLPIFPTKQPHIMTSGEIVGENSLAVAITAYTTIKDVESVWFMIKERQKEIKKRLNFVKIQSQAGENPKLIYAIYKQRLKHNRNRRKTYAEIFRLYQDGELPGYGGGDNQYGSVESLKRYYYTHSPKWDGF